MSASSDKGSPKMLREIDVFISSPADVLDERCAAIRVIERFNRLHRSNQHYFLKPLAYEEIVPAIVGHRPQAIVDRYMLEASKADIFICLLWHRMGTPVIDEETETTFESGTAYEFQKAYQANQQDGKPYILLYRCIRPAASDVDTEQLRQVQAFFQRLEGTAAEIKGLYKKYETREQFEEMLFHDLDSILAQDKDWLSIDTPPPLPALERKSDANHISWGEALVSDSFYGRNAELTQLEHMIQIEHCRLITIYGQGGVGKSVLAAQLAKRLLPHLDFLFWRSLRNAPPLHDLLEECLNFLSGQQQSDIPRELDKQLSLLVSLLRDNRCLLVLDNIETILPTGIDSPQGAKLYRADYEEYGLLFERIGSSQHQSCLLLTGRERLRGLQHLEGKTTMTRTFPLEGVNREEGRQILLERTLFGQPEDWNILVDRYAGNPLALLIVSDTIQELFGGNISQFLAEGEVILSEIEHILDQQFARLSDLEQAIMYWLAVERELVSLNNLIANFAHPVSRKIVLDALEALRRRSLIERGGTGAFFTLQSVVMEYVTDRFIKIVEEELIARHLSLFLSHALMKAQTRDYVRDSQMLLILAPLLDRLLTRLRIRGQVQRHLLQILADLRTSVSIERHYGGGNVINLLLCLGETLQGYDFSHLTIRQAYLRGFTLHDVNFSCAHLMESVFTEVLGGILAIAISPDGKILATGGEDRTIRLWDASTGHPLAILEGHQAPIWSVVFSSDNTMIASGGEDWTVCLWSVVTGKSLTVLHGHQNRIRSVSFSPDNATLASGSDDGIIKVWSVSTGQCLSTLQGHKDWVWAAIFNPDGTLLVSASEDGMIKFWNIHTGEMLQSMQAHTGRIWSIAFNASGTLLASGGEDRAIKLWDGHTGRYLDTLLGHAGRIRSIAFSPDGSLLASGSEDRGVKVWDVAARQHVATLRGHQSQVVSVFFGPDGNILMSGSENRTIKVWEVRLGRCIKTWQGFTDRVVSVALNADSTLVADGSEDASIHLWNVQTGHQVSLLQGHTSRVRSLAFHPNSTLLASGSEDRIIKLWDIPRGICRATLQGHSGWVWVLAFTPDGSRLISGSEDRDIKLWDVQRGLCLATLQGHTGQVWGIAISPDGHFLASRSEDRTVRLWDLHSGTCQAILQGHTGWIGAIAFSANGQVLASASADKTIRLWQRDTGECLSVLPHSADAFGTAMTFSPDLSLLATVSTDPDIRLWEVQSGQSVGILQGHTDWLNRVDFSSDGRLLVSASEDGTVKIWDVQQKKYLQTLRSERPYERMNIISVTGLTEAQLENLLVLGAVMQ